jgi:hypothetical protein
MKESTGETPKAVEMFRRTTKTGDFAHNLSNQVWAGFWSDKLFGSNPDTW